ncbi:MAG: p1 [Haloplasmataceae bacterium]|nr:p1 [Haloplasmataceae bacterium]
MIKIDYAQIREYAVKLLEQRGVTLLDIAKITLEVQKKYYDDLTIEECLDHVANVLNKREVLNTVLTGITIDILAEQGHIEEPLKSILTSDYSLYGIDEVLAYSIVNVYGSIGLTNFGYIDKMKLGIIEEIDRKGHEGNNCNTFLDDIIGAIAAAAASRIAHTR